MFSIILLISAVAAAELLISSLRKKKDMLALKYAARALAVAAVLELTIFQFPSYRLIGGNYPRMLLFPSGAAEYAAENVPDPGHFTGTDEHTLTYQNLNVPLGTVKVNISYGSDEMKKVSFYADMTDDTGYYYRMKLIMSELVRDCPTSEYAMALLSGNAGTARFRFAGIAPDDDYTITSIELNTPVPFDVIPLRVLLITLLTTFLFSAVRSFNMKRSFAGCPRFCMMSAAVIASGMVFIMSCMTLMKLPGSLPEQFRLDSGDQITEELVLAFENGQVYLPDAPEPELLGMENPYDWGKRHFEDIPYKWDHVLYNGHYYSYYGVAPLLLFLPYHLITGHFFSTELAVLLFSSAGVLFLTLIYIELFRRRFDDIPAGCFISGLVILLLSCGIWFCTGRPKFYEIAVSAGFMFLTAAVYCMIRAGLFSGRDVKLLPAGLSSLFMELSVLSRPTMAVYAVCGCIFWIYGAFCLRQSRKKLPLYLVCVFAPITVLAVFQMWYNYARFGSVLEFGIKYSLTINDFTHAQYHTHFVLVGLYNFLLAPPAFIPDYPYVTTPFSQLGMNGYYFNDDGNTSGILFLALPVSGYILTARVLKKLSHQTRRLALPLGLACIAAPVIIVCSTWESGYALRYTADISWEIVTGALMILFAAYRHSSNGYKKHIFSGAMAVSAVWSVIVCGVQAYNYAFNTKEYPEYAENIRRLMELWH